MSQHCLAREDLFSLERYAEVRPRMRAEVLEHKRRRQLAIGPDVTLYFEDRATIQYQVQEMLRIERIFEPAAIQEELDVYNPLIPDGRNWKATMMIEFPDEQHRREQLAKMRGIEDRIWMRVEDHDPVWAVADEDLERSDASKTSAVHFLRFELSEEMIGSLRLGKSISAGIDHPAYGYLVDSVPATLRSELSRDVGAEGVSV